jgi:outer membrane protein
MNFKMKRNILFVAALSAALMSSPAVAREGDGFVKLGISWIDLVDKGVTEANGVADPTAGYKTEQQMTATMTLGYFVANNIALEASASLPVSTQNIAGGSLTGLGNLFDEKYAIFTATATYHPLRGRTVSPYIGGGLALYKVLSVGDAVVTNGVVNDGFGAVIQGGVDFNVSRQVGLFVDAKKAFVDTRARGNLGTLNLTSMAQTDPLMLQAGASVKF